MSLAIARSPIEHSPIDDVEEKAQVRVRESPDALGDPDDARHFWFQREKNSSRSNAIATQPSVYDDPDLAETYQPPSSWENIHRFDPSARWTWKEENKVVAKIDLRIMVLACVMVVALELDRCNVQQANADSFLDDLNITRDDYNLGNTLYRLFYLLSELPAQVIGKSIGVDRWIPLQMTTWSIVAIAQFWLRNRTSFLICRALIGVLSGGFTPTMILYLSYFYKHHELSVRLGFWYAASSLADIVAGLLAYGILHLRGVDGYAGWRWLFLIEGLFTLTLGLLAFLMLPPSVTQTAHWARGRNGWFTPREETILVNRIVREDPSKCTANRRHFFTPRDVWCSIMDFDLWPLYLLGLTFMTPWTTVSQYFTLFLIDYGFNTFQAVLLSIPYNVMDVILRLVLVYAAETFGSIALMGALAQVWMLPMLLYMIVVDFSQVNKWVAWTILTLFLSHPSAHALQAGWNSRNSNSVRSRAVSAAIYNMCVQLSGIIASNIYQDDDSQEYSKGNRVLLGLTVSNIFFYIATKVYYVLRNRYRDQKWRAMTEDQRVEYIATTEDQGNKRLEFRFAH
ncbi:hypothetical protein EYZ11_003972 [Aspergillus tanneri]|uniref:Major facilitator superfamily (MFS) profile domain-containing protein n=1 Tax=Aspergillus tanneri TaxID=1220188 RepID=A0A4S3JP10_9EURO|nr:uncharacterized protein ATNIH1004_000673 [Aspergillus tanneri]KAA8651777.1 hypothetical protein ATNIH1004_000673 [Aspergillus tanneri]THC96528.1 hypothetical protein EYZ11_003972 [Aspergillus tanneri]